MDNRLYYIYGTYTVGRKVPPYPLYDAYNGTIMLDIEDTLETANAKVMSQVEKRLADLRKGRTLELDTVYLRLK